MSGWKTYKTMGEEDSSTYWPQHIKTWSGAWNKEAASHLPADVRAAVNELTQPTSPEISAAVPSAATDRKAVAGLIVLENSGIDFDQYGTSVGGAARIALTAGLLERHWVDTGRPSYRVSPTLGAALVNTGLKFSVAFLRLPHAVFSVEIPDGVDLFESGGDGWRLESILIGAKNPEGLLVRQDGMFSRMASVPWTAPTGEGGVLLSVVMRYKGGGRGVFAHKFPEGVSIEESLRHVSEIRSWPTARETHRREVLALVVGAAMFAVSANSGLVKRVERASGSKNKKRKRKVFAPRPKTWTLGADIQLPGGRSESSLGESDGPSGELRFSHIRQGHLRMQRVGPRADPSYVLKYIGPTVVRPDLPLAERATRHRLDSA